MSGWSFLSFRGGLDWILGAMPIVPNVVAEFGLAVIEKWFFSVVSASSGISWILVYFFPFLQLY